MKCERKSAGVGTVRCSLAKREGDLRKIVASPFLLLTLFLIFTGKWDNV
jgi:hypothetical protein